MRKLALVVAFLAGCVKPVKRSTAGVSGAQFAWCVWVKQGPDRERMAVCSEKLESCKHWEKLAVSDGRRIKVSDVDTCKLERFVR